MRGADDDERDFASATPRRALEELRKRQADQANELRAAVGESMLATCGELGYRNVAVRDVLERSGCSRMRFYRLFTSKADCYERAYGAEIERLCGALLDAAAEEETWRSGLRTALRDLALYVTLRPALARGLLVEVHATGGLVLAKRMEMIERLSRAINRARRENESRHSPPPITAEFIVFTIEQSVVRALAKSAPDLFVKELPELAHLAVTLFFGVEEAREDMAAVREATQALR